VKHRQINVAEVVRKIGLGSFQASENIKRMLGSHRRIELNLLPKAFVNWIQPKTSSAKSEAHSSGHLDDLAERHKQQLLYTTCQTTFFCFYQV
jgi:hypothetical protein